MGLFVKGFVLGMMSTAAPYGVFVLLDWRRDRLYQREVASRRAGMHSVRERPGYRQPLDDSEFQPYPYGESRPGSK